MPGNILIIDDEEALRRLLGRIISLEGFHVHQAATLKEGLQLLSQNKIDLVLCDVKLQDGNGVEFVKELKEKYCDLEVILLTAFGNIADGVQAIKNGAFDYITKGNDNDRIIPLLNMAMDKIKAQKKPPVTIRQQAGYHFESIIGHSSAILGAIELAKKIARTDTTVLLLGETGTGKEVFANAIHANSNRAAKSFVAINCSSFARDLLEGELFGHKAGAFTGATRDKKGLIEMADGGTLLLDEIGELHIDLQAKLLRVLENGEFIKLGDIKASKVNVRLIAATNRDLFTEVQNGRFREDLYYRLNVFTIILPPLRERKSDIPALVDYFLQDFALKENGPVKKMDKAALQLLERYAWRGNIRELKNALQRAVILTEGDQIGSAQLPFEIQKASPASSQNDLALAAVEKDHIQRVLLHTKGNKTQAAELLGIGLTTLYRKIEEYHIGVTK